MADITAKDIQSLRIKTGCGMMDCKNALIKANGDFDEAIKLLRERGLAVAAKKADRIAADGIVETYYDPATGTGVILEVNSETDFVAKNEDFKAFVSDVAKIVAVRKPADVAALLELPFLNEGITVAAKLRDKILAIGENLTIRRFAVHNGVISTYIHGGGRIGVLVRFDTDASVAAKPEFAEVAKDIAMQIAAANPLYIAKEDVPAEVIEREKEILLNQIKNDEKNKNKPAAIVEKMVSGRIGKYYDENCLVEQSFIKDDANKVAQYLAGEGKKLGGAIKVAAFERFEKGEGIEKRKDNFAEEIANMLK